MQPIFQLFNGFMTPASPYFNTSVRQIDGITVEFECSRDLARTVPEEHALNVPLNPEQLTH